MPTPFMCHECDKPTMNNSGICDNCEQAFAEGNNNIFATVRELEEKIKWFERAMGQIIICCDLRDNFGMIEDIAKTALDGEPTTADEQNKDYIEYRDTGDEHHPPKKKTIIQNIGYRGED